jgi:hypothetical protein
MSYPRRETSSCSASARRSSPPSLFRCSPSPVRPPSLLPLPVFERTNPFFLTGAQNIFAVFALPAAFPPFSTISDFSPRFHSFNELKTNSQSRLNLVIGTSIGSAAVICSSPSSTTPVVPVDLFTSADEVLGVLGYLTFGAAVGGNIIECVFCCFLQPTLPNPVLPSQDVPSLDPRLHRSSRHHHSRPFLLSPPAPPRPR